MNTDPHQRSRYRVLVVEDIPTLRRAYAFALEHSGYEVTAVGNGSTALGVLDVHRPDVVVTEVAMPVMDGITLIRIMRSRGIDAPVLALADDDFLRGLALHVGADRFLAQPIGPAELLEAVATLVTMAREGRTAERDSA